MNDVEILTVLAAAAAAAEQAMTALDDWGLSGARDGQYHADVAADGAAVEVLLDAGLGVLSEESGRQGPGREVTVVLDPLDGSTNASRGLPWYAVSLCAVDRYGPRVALVANPSTGVGYDAIRGGGARRNGEPIARPSTPPLQEAVVAVSGLPPSHLGWGQFRALGAAALDLCAVADGTLDGFVDCSHDAHGCWDYLGGLLVCHEAGASVVDARGRELVVLDHAARRTPVAGGSAELTGTLLELRQTW